MPGVKVTNFMGVAPKVSPELLPETVSQIARNAKVYSGDLIPYPEAVVAANSGRTGIVRTIYALRHPSGALAWLSWMTNVDIVMATPEDEQDLGQRYYYTGDGRPKVSDYNLSFPLGEATPPPNPTNWYELGLPLPPNDQKLHALADPEVASVSESYARDNANTATIVTQLSHGLITGNMVTITGFTYRSGTYSQASSTITVTIAAHGLSVGGEITLNFKTGATVDGTYVVVSVVDEDNFTVTAADTASTSGNVDWDIRNFNATSVEVTVKDSTTAFSYFSPGPEVATTPSLDGKISIAGNTQERKYVFTWLTPWEEESIASEPSDPIYVKEGQAVTVSEIPTEADKPEGNYYIRGVNLYRTVPSAVETEYYLLQTLWWPIAVSTVERTSDIVQLTTLHPHNLDPEDRFRLAYCSDSSLDGDFVVLDVINQYTFTYSHLGMNLASTPVTGFVYHDVAETPDDSPRYWGYYSYDFYDDFDSKALSDVLETDEYDAPVEGLRGLTIIQNNILTGYVGNTVYFSEPGKPHAWPKGYGRVLEHLIVGTAVLNGSLIVLTEGYPYLISTNDPAAGISVVKIDALFPCVSGRGIVKLANAVAYPTNDGMAVYSSAAGSMLISKFNYNDDTWKDVLDPRKIIAGYYNEAYFASFTTEPLPPGEVEEPDPPAIPATPLPPPPLGGSIDGGAEPPTPGVPVPPDPEVAYIGDIITGAWVQPTGSTDDGKWEGYVSVGIRAGTGEVGDRSPEMFIDGIRSLVEVTHRTRYVYPHGVETPYEQRTYVAITGFTSNPNGTPDEPLSIRVGDVILLMEDANNFGYDSGAGRGTWRWGGDPLGFAGKVGLLREVTVRMSP